MRGWSLTRLGLIVAGGAFVGVVAFAVTGSTAGRFALGPLCRTRTIAEAQFDPWTGLGRSDVYECVRVDGSGVAAPPTVEGGRPIRTWLGTRHAIPLPLGVPAGWVFVAIVLAVRERGHLRLTWRPRRDLSTATLVAGFALLVGVWLFVFVAW